MAKFYGVVGYGTMAETAPGVWVEQITERLYYGDLIRNTRKLQSADQLNENVNVANEISIVADPFAKENFHSMRYVEFMGAKWKIPNVDVRYPRLILSIGDVYIPSETAEEEFDDEKRIELHEVLCSLLGSRNCYFQPPDKLTMRYPCIVYRVNAGNTEFANNKPYGIERRYQVIAVSKNPDNPIFGKIAHLPKCTPDRPYTTNNLNHYPFNLYY